MKVLIMVVFVSRGVLDRSHHLWYSRQQTLHTSTMPLLSWDTSEFLYWFRECSFYTPVGLFDLTRTVLSDASTDNVFVC